MILSKRDYLAEIKNKLPRYCVPRKRKGYYVVYFVIPKHMRPESWPNKSIEVGRTNKHTMTEIVARGKELYAEFQNVRLGKHAKPRVSKGSLAHVIQLYKESEYWDSIAPSTRHNYLHMLQKIFEWSEAAGHPHISLMTTPTLIEFLDGWKGTPRTRKHYKSLMSRLFQVAISKGFSTHNLTRDIALPKSKRDTKKKLVVWTPQDIDVFINTALAMNKPNVAAAVAISWESFRQTDVFNQQEPRDYRDGFFVLETSKTRQKIMVKARELTKNLLAKRPKTQLLLTINDHSGKQWTKNSFYNQFKQVAVEAGLEGHVFKQIRNGAAIHALKADLTDREYEQRYGWSKDTVKQMIKLYTDIDQDLIDSGADKIHSFEAKLKEKLNT